MQIGKNIENRRTQSFDVGIDCQIGGFAYLEVAFGGEGFLAHGAPERFVAGVGAHVNLQRRAGREVLAADAAQVLRGEGRSTWRGARGEGRRRVRRSQRGAVCNAHTQGGSVIGSP